MTIALGGTALKLKTELELTASWAARFSFHLSLSQPDPRVSGGAFNRTT
jgi:hypothetical protein